MSDAKNLFTSIEKFVSDSRSLLSDGASVEMAGLDRQVQALCEQVLQLSGDDREKYADLLQSLLDELTALGGDLLKQRDALAHEIRYLSSHKKASVAYKTSDAVDGFANKKNAE